MPTLDEILAPIAPEYRKWASVVIVDGPPEAPTFEWHHFKNQPDATDFWPASCIKLYTVVGALLRLNELGLSALDCVVAYEHQEPDGSWVLDTARTVREMLSEVFRRSSNEDYTLLLRLCGLDWLSSKFFTPPHGFQHTALMRGYVTTRPWVYKREERQRITAYTTDGKRQVIEHKWSGQFYSESKGATVIDAKTGNVTTTKELAECLRRILFHEHLPKAEQYALTADQLRFLRTPTAGFTSLQTTNADSGPSAWLNGVDQVFPQATFYHKCGLISDHCLEAAYVDDFKDSGKRFLLVPVIQAGHATKPKNGETLIGEMSKAIALWVRGR